MARKPNSDPYQCPFTVVIDSNEGSPFGFQGLMADADAGYADEDKTPRRLIVPIRFMSLGRVQNSVGDYSILGLTDRIGVERKSMEDAWATVLGWGSSNDKPATGLCRRERFKQQLANMATLDGALVVVEATLATCLQNIPEWGDRDPEHNRKIFHRSVLSMMLDFHIPWLFCDSRRLAEVVTFRYLERFWKKEQERIKAAASDEEYGVSDQ
jgi:DNA excision repair protein ERCC-4